ncbi:MAG: dTMP kinase [Holosporales bacterium]|jgi:dTMP kinase|nr:dTMP kinase [Holosporales bacterium]
MTRATRGQFITFEGGEGTGKSTQIQRAAAYLRAKNVPVEVVREPGSTPEGEALRNLWNNPSTTASWEPLTEALLLFAARRTLLCRIIWPHLQQGTWVLCDRFYDSTLVYQGVLGGVDIEKLMQLKYLIMEDFEPDLTLLFDMPAQLALRRISKRQDIQHDGVIRYDTMALQLHEKIRQAYLQLADIFSFRARIVKARASADIVEQAVCTLLETHKETL